MHYLLVKKFPHVAHGPPSGHAPTPLCGVTSYATACWNTHGNWMVDPQCYILMLKYSNVGALYAQNVILLLEYGKRTLTDSPSQCG